jgi:dihydroxy-acid dehydratase
MSAKARKKPEELRSHRWFGVDDLRSFGHRSRAKQMGFAKEDWAGKPVIAILNTWSDINPCHTHFKVRVEEVKRGVWQAGGFPIEMPAISLSEPFQKPTTMLYRNLLAMETEELLRSYPADGVVLMGGCDKTTPACIMAAATVNIPAIVLSGGPMLNGWWKGERTGSGTVVWTARERHAAGDIDYDEFMDIVSSSAPSVGHCNTMGTASTMNGLAEALGMSLPGCAAIPAPYRERGQIAYETGLRAVEMVREDLKPSDILTRQAFENAIVVNSAIGGSTNAPIHINAIARHIGIELTNDDWEKIGYDIPLIVNLQPAGKYLGEEFHRAGGIPAVVNELMKHGKIHEDAITANGRPIGENCRGREAEGGDVILPYEKPMVDKSGFLHLRGNLFDSAIMKTSVISPDFRQRYLSDPKQPNVFEGRAIVFEGPEDYHHRIDDASLKIDETCMLFVRGTGPIGYPGGAEVVNMQPPAALIKQGILALPCIGDGRQSGTSGSPSILNAVPEAALNGGLAILQTGDRVRIDLNERTADILIPPEEYEKRKAALMDKGGFPIPDHQTPWQEIQRGMVAQFDEGMVLKPAVKYQRVAQTKGVARDNH